MSVPKVVESEAYTEGPHLTLVEKRSVSAAPFSGPDRAIYLLAFIFLFGLLTISRVYGRTHQSLWFDEGYTVALATASSFHDFWVRFGHSTTSEHLQPLYYLLMFMWVKAAGTSDASLRLLSSLFSIASGLAAYRAVSILAGTRRSLALLAFAAITFSSFSLYYGQEARPYALLQLASFAFLVAWLQARTTTKGSAPTLKSRIVLAVCCSFCFLTSVFSGLLVISVAFSDLLISKDLKNWLQRWQISVALSFVTYLGYLVPCFLTMSSFISHDITDFHQALWLNVAYSLYGITFGTTLAPAATLLRGSDKLRVALSFWPIILPALLALGALIVGSVQLIRKAKKSGSDASVLLLSLCVYSLIFFGFLRGVGHLNVLPRHSSALFSLLFVVIGACASQVTFNGAKPARYLLVFGLAGYFVLNCISLYGYYSDPLFQKDDYRDTAKVMNRATDPVFVVAGDPLLLARYGAKSNDATSIDPPALASFIQAKSGNAPNVVLVFNGYRNFRWKPGMSVPRAMSPSYDCKTIDQLTDFDIYSCRYHGAISLNQ